MGNGLCNSHNFDGAEQQNHYFISKGILGFLINQMETCNFYHCTVCLRDPGTLYWRSDMGLLWRCFHVDTYIHNSPMVNWNIIQVYKKTGKTQNCIYCCVCVDVLCQLGLWYLHGIQGWLLPYNLVLQYICIICFIFFSRIILESGIQGRQGGDIRFYERKLAFNRSRRKFQ